MCQRQWTAAFAVAILLVVHSPLNAKDTPQATVSHWPAHQRMSVELTSDEHLVGHLGAVQPDSFTLDPDHKSGAPKEIQFAQVKSLNKKMTTAHKWEIFAVVYGAVTIMALILGK